MGKGDLESDYRAVVAIADYLEELKTAVTQLGLELEANQRGFFTPNEEERTRGLLVSYWQSRSALLDIVNSFQAGEPLSGDDEYFAFLIAFSAGILLVDAARTLRDRVHHSRLIRRKLNEPAVEFGIPGGVYDQVQKSLLSARNAWHLYHAIQYYQQYQSELQHFAARHGRQALIEIIRSRQQQLDISVARFARVKLRTRGSQIARKLARTLIGRALYGLQKLGGSLVADRYLKRGHRPCLPDPIAALVQQQLCPGDVLVVRKEYALTNYFLPGYWPHAALYLGDREVIETLGLDQLDQHTLRSHRIEQLTQHQKPCVLESMKDGVHLRPLTSPFASDSIVVLRPRLPQNLVADALRRGLRHEGKPYDFDFDFRRSDRLVCTEVIYRTYDGIGPVEMPLTQRAGRPTLAGQDLIRMGIQQQHFEPVLVYAPKLIAGIQTGKQAEEVLRQSDLENTEI